jgi:cystathionine beta-lyase
MSYNFDQIINRKNTHSYKWDQNEKLFGSPDILPLWVADMDFESPPAVKQALLQRAQHGVYGYTIKDSQTNQSMIDWFARRQQWRIDSSWISDSPSIVTSLSIAVELYSLPGDSVIIQSPVYYPFYDVIRMNDREVATNPLLLHNGRYDMDFAHLESLMKQGAKLMLLCSPHNPGGRVWTREELTQLGELAIRYDVTMISDEIHSDLLFPGHTHTPFASISEAFAEQSITLLAPTKTFNLPGLSGSFAIIRNNAMKRKFDYRIKTLSLHMTSFFHNEFVTAAYRDSEQWLDELLDYLECNMIFALRFFAEQLPAVIPMKPEATYLLWVDCRQLGLEANEMKELMFKRAKVAFSEGSVFGLEGNGYLRINLACPRAILQEALSLFCDAASNR